MNASPLPLAPNHPLDGRRILLGVSGGIAAYKAVDLTRRLIEWGAQVQVVMTPGATTFVTPLTFQAVSGRPVRHELLDPVAEAGMGHIELARWPDLILIAPASADCLARLATGQANDLLSTTCLAGSDRPLAVAPAMNRLMWEHPATQHNIELLRQRGVAIWGPGQGEQACGEHGAGRMLEALDLRDRVKAHWPTETPLNGIHVLLTAGPTREPIDPVRYISNRSSGRMGFALAEAARQAGADVTLVSGPVSLPTPVGCRRIDVESAAQMHQAVMAHVGEAQIFIACAAVADYRLGAPSEQKMKKTAEVLTLKLVRNPDILAEVAALPQPPFCLGFAAETEHLEAHARAKLQRKKLHMIAANWVGEGRAFDHEDNALHVLWSGGEAILEQASKRVLARQLLQLLAQRYNEVRPSSCPNP